MQHSNHKWYVLYTRTNFEMKVNADILTREFESYLPLQTIWRKWSDRRKRLFVPLFPNYVFVKMPLREKTKVLSIPGVIKLISVDREPIAVSEDDLEKVRRLVESNKDLAVEVEKYVGMKVRVVSGVFAGLEGEIIRVSNRARLLVKLGSINQALSVEMEQGCVEKLEC